MTSPALATAVSYSRRGWPVVPIPHQSKNPGFHAWEQLRLTEEDLPARFGDGPQNIGVLLGEPSGWLIDIDLDHARCIEIADQFLPPTPAVFGRPGKPRSHRIYRVTAPVATKKHRSKSAGMLIELRSTGAQTVIPPSTHESGEPITWEDENAEPAAVDPKVLLEAVRQIADAVKIELGEKEAPQPPKPAPERPHRQKPGPAERIPACIDAMRRMEIQDSKDGSLRLFAAACRVVEFNLSDADAIAAIREYAHEQPFPREWSDEEILKRIRDAEALVRRGTIGYRRPVSEGEAEVPSVPLPGGSVCEWDAQRANVVEMRDR
ncbi:MAG: bifunctional DNA primase/polymerase [Phycisphaerales bacterium]|nr:bifunctional DNA primase/polymerase [Phycisphaerales bacterium]